jgi:hypothetical protein
MESLKESVRTRAVEEQTNMKYALATFTCLFGRRILSRESGRMP